MNCNDLTFALIGLRYGFNLKKMMDFVNENQYWSKDQIYDYQLRHLRKIVRHAYANVPYYRNVMQTKGMHPDDIKSLDDLSHFPVISKEDIIANYSDFLSRDYQRYQPWVKSTGGTTGVPFKYYNDAKSWGLNWATKIRAFQWGGYHLGKDEIAVLKGGSIYNEGKIDARAKVWRWIQKNYSFRIMNMSDETMSVYAKDMVRKKIKYMRGYPSAIFTFALWVKENNVKIKLNKIFTTAEMLLPQLRTLIEEVFGCNIIDAYGCGDGMAGASQCNLSDKFHVNIETSIMELLDSDLTNKVSPGETGEIVLTSLHDYAMPFIRYTPGDQAVVSKKPCTCGVTLPTLDRIIGRVSDVFFLPNGRVLNGLSIPLEIWSDRVRKFQIIHEKPALIVVKLVVKEAYGQEDEQTIIDLLRKNTGEGIDIEIQVVDDIPLTKAGKYKYVISKVEY
jgi:phenylacetate-CoA ligase